MTIFKCLQLPNMKSLVVKTVAFLHHLDAAWMPEGFSYISNSLKKKKKEKVNQLQAWLDQKVTLSSRGTAYAELSS